MYLNRVHRTFPRLKHIITRSQSQAALAEQNEYTESPEYPPILDMSSKAKSKRQRADVHQKIQKLNTVEEKQIALNMPRYYGFRCIMLNENKVPYNAMPLIQYYTRSHFIPIDKLPEVYAETADSAAIVTKEIKSFVEEAIVLENDGIEYNFTAAPDKTEASQKEDAFAKRIVKQINRIITNNLTDKVPHILSAQVDYDVRHEAFWFVGGIEPPHQVVTWKKQHNIKDANESIDRPVQYIGSSMLTVRSKLPLKPLVPYSEASNPEFKVPEFTYVPGCIGYMEDHRHGTNIPGYWPGDFDEYGLISYHGRGQILDRKASFGPEDNLEALHCLAMKASFGWLLAQANYQGFTTFNDLTYPLVTQTVFTNGQLWSLYSYQLNTITMHNDEINNPKHNLCFGTKPLKLYDCIEDGKVKGLNEDVLKMIVQFYLNAPEEREHDMKPYLGKEEQVVADIEDDNKRCWLESRYKHLVSNRPKHLLLPEVYLWEKIYKIKFNTRFFEPKRRPFELDINPYRRRLDEHLPPYIPKALRPYPKSKKKFETTYYPKV